VDVAVIPDRLTLRAGVFYETAVADAAYASVDFLRGPQFGGGAGASVMFGHWKLMLAYQGRVQQTVSVTEADARGYQQVPGARASRPTRRTGATRTTSGSRRPPSTPARTTRLRTFVLLAAQYRYGL
jgi:hypothetical protein